MPCVADPLLGGERWVFLFMVRFVRQPKRICAFAIYDLEHAFYNE